MTTLADLKKWEPWVNILKASKITQLAMQKWMAVVSSASELNVLKGIKSTTKELNVLSKFTGDTTKLNRHVDPKVTVVNEATYTIKETDSIIHVTYSATATCTITWPTKLITDQYDCLILDAGGNASQYNITLATEGSETIDGDASWIINGDYDWIWAYSDESNLFIRS